MTFEQMLTIHLQKKVNRFRSILTGSSQPGLTGSLAIWFRHHFSVERDARALPLSPHSGNQSTAYHMVPENASGL